MADILDIAQIAKLSRLELTQAEKEKYATQMGGVLEYAEMIVESSFATSGESFATPEESPGQIQVGIINGVIDVMREDEIGESLPREKALKNAPAQKSGFIQVKAVFGAGE